MRPEEQPISSTLVDGSRYGANFCRTFSHDSASSAGEKSSPVKLFHAHRMTDKELMERLRSEPPKPKTEIRRALASTIDYAEWRKPERRLQIR